MCWDVLHKLTSGTVEKLSFWGNPKTFNFPIRLYLKPLFEPICNLSEINYSKGAHQPEYFRKKETVIQCGVKSAAWPWLYKLQKKVFRSKKVHVFCHFICHVKDSQCGVSINATVQYKVTAHMQLTWTYTCTKWHKQTEEMSVRVRMLISLHEYSLQTLTNSRECWVDSRYSALGSRFIQFQHYSSV